MTEPDRTHRGATAAAVDAAIRARDVVKTYAGTPVLRGVTLDVDAGATLAILGENGAGKTTLLHVLATVREPTSGTVRLLGIDVAGNQRILRSAIGFVGHRGFAYPDLTAGENLRLFAGLYGVPDATERIDALLARVGLRRHGDRRVRELSRGMAQRLELARALLHDPALLFLDEPDTGLDAAGLALLEAIVSERGLGGTPRTTVLTTHREAWGRAFAGRVVRVHQGRLVREAAEVPA